MLVGFDLDMTLVDSSAGIAATLQAALAEVGVTAEGGRIWPHIGVPLATVIDDLAPQVDRDAVITRYRELYPALGIPSITVLPGVLETLAVLRSSGHQVAVVSAKLGHVAKAVLDAVGLEVDEIVGDLFATAKGHWLLDNGAQVYVGDHPGDMQAARSAGAVGVGVCTGPHDAGDLERAGADVILADLRDFPAWWAGSSGVSLGHTGIGGDVAPLNPLA
jgi:phosphoglycolate phosphatase